MANTPQNIVGFETGDATYEKQSSVGGSVNVQSTTKRSGNYALRINPAGANTSLFRIGGFSAAGAATTITTNPIYFDFYFYYVTAPASSNEPIANVTTGSAALRMEVRLNSDGTLSVYDSTLTLVSTGTTILTANMWYRISIMSSQGAAAYALKINGATELSGTADQAAGANFYVAVGKTNNRNSNSVDFYYDDLWLDTTDFAPSDYRVGIMTPVSDDSVAWTGTYANIDEIPTSTSDFINSNGISAATFNMRTFASSGISDALSIHAVKAYSWTADTAVVTNTYTVGIRSNVTNSMTTNLNAGAAQAETSKIIVSDPNTSAAWTKAGLEAAKLRVSEGTAAVTSMEVYAGYFMVAYTPTRVFSIT